MSIMVTNTVLVIHALINTLSVMLHRFYKLNFSVWLLLCKKRVYPLYSWVEFDPPWKEVSYLPWNSLHIATESGITPDSFP